MTSGPSVVGSFNFGKKMATLMRGWGGSRPGKALGSLWELGSDGGSTLAEAVSIA